MIVVIDNRFNILMRIINIVAFICFASGAIGQNTTFLENALYMDTMSDRTIKCNNYTAYFYQVGGKYPENSASLLKELLLFQHDKTQFDSGNGNITFRFTVNCEGQVMRKVQVIQTDEKYNLTHFQKPLIDQLFLFFKSLKKWKIVKDRNAEPLNYHAFITFKIKNGKVTNIIP